MKEKKLRQLGELVISTGADALDIDTLAGGLLAMVELGDAGRREKLRERGAAFFRKRRASLRAELVTTQAALKRAMVARRRHDLARARTDTRAWVVTRRERTRRLIELGGLIMKAGLVELTGDDRAALYGAFLMIAEMLRDDDRERALALWGRRGKRAFDDR